MQDNKAEMAQILAKVLELILAKDAVSAQLEMALIADNAQNNGVDHEQLMSYVNPDLVIEISTKVRAGLKEAGQPVPPPLSREGMALNSQPTEQGQGRSSVPTPPRSPRQQTRDRPNSPSVG